MLPDRQSAFAEVKFGAMIGSAPGPKWFDRPLPDRWVGADFAVLLVLPCEPGVLSVSRRAQTVICGRERGHADKRKGFCRGQKIEEHHGDLDAAPS